MSIGDRGASLGTQSPSGCAGHILCEIHRLGHGVYRPPWSATPSLSTGDGFCICDRTWRWLLAIGTHCSCKLWPCGSWSDQPHPGTLQCRCKQRKHVDHCHQHTCQRGMPCTCARLTRSCTVRAGIQRSLLAVTTLPSSQGMHDHRSVLCVCQRHSGSCTACTSPARSCPEMCMWHNVYTRLHPHLQRSGPDRIVCKHAHQRVRRSDQQRNLHKRATPAARRDDRQRSLCNGASRQYGCTDRAYIACTQWHRVHSDAGHAGIQHKSLPSCQVHTCRSHSHGSDVTPRWMRADRASRPCRCARPSHRSPGLVRTPCTTCAPACQHIYQSDKPCTADCDRNAGYCPLLRGAFRDRKRSTSPALRRRSAHDVRRGRNDSHKSCTWSALLHPGTCAWSTACTQSPQGRYCIGRAGIVRMRHQIWMTSARHRGSDLRGTGHSPSVPLQVGNAQWHTDHRLRRCRKRAVLRCGSGLPHT